MQRMRMRRWMNSTPYHLEAAMDRACRDRFQRLWKAQTTRRLVKRRPCCLDKRWAPRLWGGTWNREGESSRLLSWFVLKKTCTSKEGFYNFIIPHIFSQLLEESPIKICTSPFLLVAYFIYQHTKYKSQKLTSIKKNGYESSNKLPRWLEYYLHCLFHGVTKSLSTCIVLSETILNKIILKWSRTGEHVRSSDQVIAIVVIHFFFLLLATSFIKDQNGIRLVWLSRTLA